METGNLPIQKVSHNLPPKTYPDSKPDSKEMLHSQAAIEKQSKFLWLASTDYLAIKKNISKHSLDRKQKKTKRV